MIDEMNVALLDRPKNRFTARSIPGCKLWLDASQLGLADGAQVSQWTDLSGSGNHMTQGTAAQRPVLKKGIINGRDVVRFDGIDDYLNKDSANADTNITLFVVVKVPNPAIAANHGLFASNNVSSSARSWNMGLNGASQWNVSARKADNTGSNNLVMGAADGNATLLTVVVNAGVWRAYKNGVDSGNTLVDPPNARMNHYRLGGNLSLASFFAMDIAELALWHRGLLDSERARIRNSWGRKYAIAV